MVSVLRPGNPVYCLHPDALRAAADNFLSGFPGCTLFAVKCNPHPLVLRILRSCLDSLWSAGLSETERQRFANGSG